MKQAVIAIDIGASSGRVMAAFLQNGVVLEEMYRFENGGIEQDGGLRWNFTRLMQEIHRGISLTAKQYEVVSIGIDTWGVDFGLIDGNGNLIEEPVHYRDSRTAEVVKQVDAVVPREERYARTGIQFLRFNTVYQLYYLAHSQSSLWEKTDKILLIPDLIAYCLTGQMRTERTNASTTDLLNAITGRIDDELLKKLGVKNVFCPLIEPGESYGTVNSELAKKMGISPVPVIAVCTHDTASAVAALPQKTDAPVAFLSSGTWSLLGAERSEPILTERSRIANFTNEVGYNRKIRYLKNIMGLWILQQIRAQYQEQGNHIGFAEMEQQAVSCPPTHRFIDVNDPTFDSPGNMLERIDGYLQRTAQLPLQTDAQRIRCVYESLAFCYRKELDALSEITQTQFSALHIFGGGIQAKLLSSLTASVCGISVICGVKEASATGNALVQMIADGAISDLKSARSLLSDSNEIFRAEPSEGEYMTENYPRYLAVIQGVRL